MGDRRFWCLRCAITFMLTGVALTASAAPTAIMEAAYTGDIAAVQAMLEADPALVREVDPEYGATPLLWAISGRRQEVVELLLKHGAPVDARGNTGLTPLHGAAMVGDAGLASCLLAAGADPVLVDNSGVTPRSLAQQQGSAAVAQVIDDAEQALLKELQKKDPPPGWFWIDALGWPAVATDGWTLFSGVSVNFAPIAIDGLGFTHGCGMFPPRELTLSCNGGVERIRLYAGVNDGGVNFEGGTLGLSLIVDGEYVCRSVQLQHKHPGLLLSVDLTDKQALRIVTDGSGPGSIAGACLKLGRGEALHDAAFRGDAAAATTALGVDPQALNRRDAFFGLTPLQCAYYGGKHNLVGLLLKSGANVGELPPALADAPDPSPMVFVPGGPFVMGSGIYREGFDRHDASPPQQVTLPAFYIDQCEVTNAQFARFMNAVAELPREWFRTGDAFRIVKVEGQWRPIPGFETHPVVNVSWYGASAYATWTEKRLPTEPEWEKAARGPNRGGYPWDGAFDPSRTNIGPDFMSPPTQRQVQWDGTVPVGTYTEGASPYGCMDMLGNVLEWTSSRYLPYPYDGSDGREDKSASGPRTQRGACFAHRNDFPPDITRRFVSLPSVCSRYVGFRCAWSAP